MTCSSPVWPGASLRRLGTRKLMCCLGPTARLGGHSSCHVGAIGITVDGSSASHVHSDHFPGHEKAELASCTPQTGAGFHSLRTPPSPAPCPAQASTGSLVEGEFTQVLSCRHTHRQAAATSFRTSPPLPSWAGVSPFRHLSPPRLLSTEVLRDVGGKEESDP